MRGFGSSTPAVEARSANALPFDDKGVRLLLSSLQANVFVATPDLRLVYANEAAVGAFSMIADDVRNQFGVTINDLFGGSIHRFHRDPARVERVLQSAPMPHQATFSFGQTTLETRINRINSADGTLLGYVVVWENQTRRRQLEEALLSAVEQLQTTDGTFTTSTAALSAAATTAAEQANAVAAAEARRVWWRLGYPACWCGRVWL